MRIILLTSSLGAGGAERVATTLCNAWAARGDKVTLIPTFSGGGKPFYRLSDSVELIYLADVIHGWKTGLMGYPKRLAALRKLIAQRTPDVVVSFLPNVNVAAIVATAGLGVPLIICERSDPSVQPYTSFWKLACRLSYRFADMLTVQTEAVAMKVPDFFPNVKRVRAVANPLPAELLGHSVSGAGARKVLLSMGRLSAEKQVSRVIAAFMHAASRFDDWDLHVYGDGPLRDTLAGQVLDLGLSKRIVFKGRTANPWDTMSAADAFVMASSYEGFPNALLEAMGVGLPCVTFDCPSGPREISDDGRNALLVPLNDDVALAEALVDVMRDEALRTSLGARARAAVHQKFSLPAIIEIWDRFFRELGAAK